MDAPPHKRKRTEEEIPSQNLNNSDVLNMSFGDILRSVDLGDFETTSGSDFDFSTSFHQQPPQGFYQEPPIPNPYPDFSQQQQLPPQQPFEQPPHQNYHEPESHQLNHPQQQQQQQQLHQQHQPPASHQPPTPNFSQNSPQQFAPSTHSPSPFSSSPFPSGGPPATPPPTPELQTPSSFSLGERSFSFEDGEPAMNIQNHIQTADRFLQELGGMESFHSSLVSAFQSKDHNQLQSLSTHVKDILQRLHHHQELLSSLLGEFILSPIGLGKVKELERLIGNKSAQLKVWDNLLVQAAHSPLSDIISAHLVLASQPFPMVVAKGKQHEGNLIELSLVVGGGVKLESCSHVFVECIDVGGGDSGQQPQQLLEETSLPVTLEQLLGGVRWPLRFASGTRRNLIKCRFSVNLTYRHGGEMVSQQCVSDETPPFIVITNECQWDDCEGDLLSYLLFPETGGGGRGSASWASVVNALQKFVLRATRQQQNVSCFLSRMTIQQIHARFFGGRSPIAVDDFGRFWKWFGKSMHKLRYQRHLCSLWLSGMFHLILARDAVNQILSPHPPGVFLVRFSESSPGHIVISYKTENPNPSESIRHYLLSPADLLGTKKSLPDFLYSQKSLVFIYQQIVGPNGHTSNKFYRKEEALDPYLNKKPNRIDNSGRYDKKLI